MTHVVFDLLKKHYGIHYRSTIAMLPRGALDSTWTRELSHKCNTPDDVSIHVKLYSTVRAVLGRRCIGCVALQPSHHLGCDTPESSVGGGVSVQHTHAASFQRKEQACLLALVAIRTQLARDR